MDSSFGSKGAFEVYEWLQSNGVSVEYCETFEGEFLECFSYPFLSNIENEIDGSAFMELTEADIKQLIKPIGVVKKIIRLQKSLPPSCSSVCKLQYYSSVILYSGLLI